MFSTKREIDRYFEMNWSLTPIQFAGTPFTHSPSKWVIVKVVPHGRDIIGIGGSNGGRKRTRQTIRVFCYESSATLAFILASHVQEFLECRVVGNTTIGVGEGDGAGALDLENGFYEVVVDFESTFEDIIIAIPSITADTIQYTADTILITADKG